MTERRTFTKIIKGRKVVQHVSTPADAVRLTFDGWRERPEAPAPAEAPEAPAPAPAVADKQPAPAADKGKAGAPASGPAPK